MRLARAVVRIEQLEEEGVRFGREAGGMLKVESPPGVVVGWRDRGLWSGIHAMVLDYLEARDAERKAPAPEPNPGEATVPATVGRMPRVPELAVETARLKEELDAARQRLATIAVATGQEQPDAVTFLADGIVTVARGAMANAYERSRNVLMREQQARALAEMHAEGLNREMEHTKAALLLEEEKRRAVDADCGVLRTEAASLRQQLAEAKRSTEVAITMGADASKQAGEERQGRHRAKEALRLVRQSLDTDVADKQLALELRKRLQAANQQADAVDAAARAAGLAPEFLPDDPGTRLRAIAQANREQALDEIAALLDAPVRALRVHLRGSAAERVPQALAVLTAAFEGRGEELARERAKREQAELEAQGWKRAYQALARHARRLVVLLARQAGLLEPAKAAWRLLVDAISHGKEPSDISAAIFGRQNDDLARDKAPNRVPRQEQSQGTGRADMTSPDADAGAIIGVATPPATTREPVVVMTDEKPRPSDPVVDAVRLTNATTDAVKALEARLRSMSKDQLLEAAQATERAVYEAGEKRCRNEHRHTYSVIARVARQRGIALQPLRPLMPRIRDEYAR